MLNENIAYAKAVLNKKGITNDSDNFKDYLKIRELCGVNTGYVGILTRIRFVDDVTDMDEIASIFDILKNSKIDVSKLNKMTYSDILNQFYDELNKDTNKDFELIYSDGEYSYFEVYTYEGILKIGSPAWCLKTKKNWDLYKEKYGRQYVVISNKYRNRLISPNDNYLLKYEPQKTFVRFGISWKLNTEKYILWEAYDDGNSPCKMTPENWTFFGIMETIFNLVIGYKESFYQSFKSGTKMIDNEWHLVTNRDAFFKEMRITSDIFIKHAKSEEDIIYLKLSKNYYTSIVCLILNDTYPYTFNFVNGNLPFGEIVNKVAKKYMVDFASKSSSVLYTGINLENGLISLDDIKKLDRYLTMVDKWLVFENKDDYSVVNTKNGNSYQIQNFSRTDRCFEMPNPMYFIIMKEKMTVHGIGSGEEKDFHKEVINAIKKLKGEPEKRVKGFFGFVKKYK